jgi:hypothetical protein
MARKSIDWFKSYLGEIKTHIDTMIPFLNRLGKVYSLEYTEIPKVFLKPQHGQ